MDPIGGYFSLELNEGRELHKGALRLNAGRYALEYVLKARKYKKVYLPYYICDSVLEPISRTGVSFEFYHINDQLEPLENLHPTECEAVLYVNYFGLKNRRSSAFCFEYTNTILDQTQAFYSEQGNKYESGECHCDTFYSCRKFFGVPDGAYLYIDCRIQEELPRDESFHRMTFLTKRIDRSAQEGYGDFQANDKTIGEMGMRGMSRLTQAIMSGIDYATKAKRRIHNFHVLDKALRKTNFFKWDLDSGTVPLVYPYYIEDGERLRKHLIEHKVFCACYWPNVIDWCHSADWEYKLTKNLVCLPIDQRYDVENMLKVLHLISIWK